MDDFDSAVVSLQAAASERGRVPVDLPDPDDLARLMAEGVPPVRFAIPELAPRGQITTFYAAVGAGKTTCYRHAIVANEQGQPFLALHDFEEAQTFVVFDWENGRDGATRDLQRLGLTTPPSRAFFYFDLDSSMYNLDTDEGRQRIRALIERHAATCAVFDARDAAFPHTPETDGERVPPAMRASLELARSLDCAFLFVSHEPKADYAESVSKLRGHTAWAQYSEQMFRIVKRGEIREIDHTKNRGIDKRPTLRLNLERGGEADTGSLVLTAHAVDRALEKAEKVTRDTEAVETALAMFNGQAQWKELDQHFAKWGSNRLRSALNSSRRVTQPKRGSYALRPSDPESELT